MNIRNVSLLIAVVACITFFAGSTNAGVLSGSAVALTSVDQFDFDDVVKAYDLTGARRLSSGRE